MSSFAIYLLGFLVLVAGLILAAVQLGVPQMWIGIGVIVLVGIGILNGVSRTRSKDPPEA